MIAAVAPPFIASYQVDFRLVPNKLYEFATLETETDLLVESEYSGVICVGVLKRLVDISLKDGSADTCWWIGSAEDMI